ncbi:MULTISPECIES: TVP38/TMEM64 family protein [Paenibacillus]|uniref:TVP38/TMEM64 family membrane protein n=1 Tax=Paenibacillus vini TaxID=1476024 RepID=A0ABQ4MGH2_9BACL|nr:MULTISPECIES: TVP38/TMEM64 family protein [Paenibacillus]MBQ4901064.1 TVP38/TMEM64 family protein [Paenibacillus sp. Marseille-P2973]MDN4068212.1 TVP38/TMEM64 family protein [Paenibacillus vini]GIP54520.1 TVP38/TMEM64 family protein [Paenibacillus vini]
MLDAELSIMDYFTEQNIQLFLDRFRSLGPLPGILLTFMKSFVPPLPTIIIVGANAAIYGMWQGFLYSWIGLVAGSLLTFLLIRKAAGSALIRRWAEKPKVQKAMVWARKNGFSFVFLLSMLPVGPFVVINMAAGLTRMPVRTFAAAVALGKAVMVFCVSYIGTHLSDFVDQPAKFLGVALFIAASLWLNRKLQAYFTSVAVAAAEPAE